MTDTEKQLLIEEFEDRKHKGDIPLDLKGGEIRSRKLANFIIHFKSNLSIAMIEEIGEDYKYKHRID